jgi:hypothetical protein
MDEWLIVFLKGSGLGLMEVLVSYLPARTEKNHENLSQDNGVKVGIRNKNLPNTSLGRYLCTSLHFP